MENVEADEMSDDWKTRLGWGPDFDQAAQPFREKGLEPARVTLVYRKQLKVLSHRGEHWARTGGRIIHRANDMSELPAVGDWVMARIPEAGEALVHCVLPRRSAFIRKASGTAAVPHILAANIDVILIVMGLDNDFNLRRLERYLALAWESRATPMVLLNKADVITDLDEQLSAVRELVGTAPTHVVSGLTGLGLEPLHALFVSGKTIALLGSSGVGKSTLVNRVLGAEVMKTGEVRGDGKGKHTTTRRELLVLPHGGALIDTPGLREVHMWESTAGIGMAFDDLEQLAQSCRFSDCRHEQEPGCAVKAALETGELDETRYESWHTLQREMQWLQTTPTNRGRPETKRRDRVGHGKRR